MRKQSRYLRALTQTCLWLAAGWAPLSIHAAESASEAARLVVYQHPASGESYYALSLSPAAEVFQSARAAGGADVVVLVDTSASQSGAYRADSLTALRTLLATLAPQDRVKLLAVDLNAIDLSGGFAAPGSREMEAALAKLERRTPLGSTDMAKALAAASESFRERSGRLRSAVYIGDGMSKANLLAGDDFRAVVDDLVRKQVPVHSYAIGPQRDMHLLAALANHTGGMMYVDAAEPGIAQQAGSSLAAVVHSPVFWPTSSALPAAFKEAYPERTPPLRPDRDTIVVGVLDGKGPQTVSLRGEVNGAAVEAKWTVTPEDGAEDVAFLPKLLDTARRDGGLSLPTVGSAGLREVGRMMAAHAESLAKMGARELSGGNVAGARKFAEAALEVDPSNPEAETLEKAVKKSGEEKQAGSGAKFHPIHFQPPPADGPAPPPADFGEGFGPDRGAFLGSALEERRIREQILTAEVQEAIRLARDLIGTAPERAIADLKLMLESIEAARDVSAELRVELRNRVLAVIQEASRVAVEVTALRAEAEARRSAAVEQQRLTDALLRDQAKIDNLMIRFNALIDEGEYWVAEQEIATQVIAIAETSFRPMTREGVVGLSAVTNARLVGNYTDIMAARDLRQRKLLDTLMLVEQSHIPFPDEPPIVYPDPAFWESLNERKEKYGSIDLAQAGPAEQRIFKELDNVTRLEFIETPLADVVEYLKDTHQIPIEIDNKALDDVGLSTDVPVTRNLSGVTLRSALRLMLRELELTYMIQDEVLLITTPEEAETQLVTKVYPVADLVLPVGMMSSMGGMMGGMGGMGGMMNGGGMGGGGMGGRGGFGGGGGGFGGGGFGGGGFFQVKDRLTDDLNLGVPKQAAPAPQPRQPAPRVERPVSRPKVKVEPISVSPQAGESPAEAWDRAFAEAKQDFDPAAVRETARRLMHKQQFDEVIAMLHAAIRHGQSQTWMYEAMGLAMQAADSPKEELERALMSAVDFSDDLDTMMFVAAYLGRVGLEQRALSLFRDVASAVPHRHEPYVQGLAVAQRIGDREAIQWASLGIVSRAWPKEERGTLDKAVRAAEALLLEMRRSGDTAAADQFQEALRDAQARDVRVVVSWTGEADLDLLVEEPSGATCSLRNQRTVGAACF
jgi:Mg-chelatase subunit ChlD/uncharacterized membrane protein YgcG